MFTEQEKQNIEQVQPVSTNNIKIMRPFFIIMAAILIVALLVVGVLLFQGSLFSGNIISSHCKFDDKDLCKFINKINSVDRLAVEKTENTVRGDKIKTIKKMQGQNKTSQDIFVNGGQPAREIDICPYRYEIDNTDGKWWRTHNSGGDSGGAVPKPKVLECFKSKDLDINTEGSESFQLVINDDGLQNTTFQKVGSEKCGNLICLKYQIFDANWKYSIKYVWFDTKDYLPRKTVEYYSDSSANLTTQSTISYDNITITEPLPIKDRPDNSCQPPNCIR